MATSIQENLITSNKKYASTFDRGDLALPPAKKYLVCEYPTNVERTQSDGEKVTCMDARIDPAQAFGIELGDAHVIRNAGASAKDGLRSIVISEQLLGVCLSNLTGDNGIELTLNTDPRNRPCQAYRMWHAHIPEL